MANMPKKPATAQQKAALAKGRATRDRRRAEAKAAGGESDRWARLISGQLTVKELDDDEIRKMRVKVNGGFEGRPRTLPSHIASQFHQEAIRRAKSKIIRNTSMVTRELLAMAKDPDVSDANRIKILMYLQDRQLGKAPETIRVEGAAEFDKVTMEALGLDREMADMQDAAGDDDKGSR